MKVALVIQNAEPSRGGAERYTVNLAGDLVARGHEVHLLAQRFARNVEPARQVRLAGAAGTRLKRYELLLQSLAQHLAEVRYDVVHAMLPVWQCDIYHPHAGIEAENVAAGHLKHPPGVGRLLARVGNALNRKRQFVSRTEERLICGPRPPLVLCLSDYVRQAALKHYASQNRHMAVLHNGVDLVKFDPAARPQRREQMRRQLHLPESAVAGLMVANDYQRKGLSTALAAMAGLTPAQRQATHLVVVGKESPDRYRAMARELRIASHVTFAGPTEDPAAFYQAADFFILPTHHDPCSLVALEALAMGLPVLTTRFNGAGELVAEGQHGFVMEDAAAAEPFTAAWVKLLKPEALAAMKAKCLALRPQISQVHHVDRLLEQYERVRK